MQVAVVGGGGFIGSHVVDHLVMAGHQVRVVDPAPAGATRPRGTTSWTCSMTAGWRAP